MFSGKKKNNTTTVMYLSRSRAFSRPLETTPIQKCAMTTQRQLPPMQFTQRGGPNMVSSNGGEYTCSSLVGKVKSIIPFEKPTNSPKGQKQRDEDHRKNSWSPEKKIYTIQSLVGDHTPTAVHILSGLSPSLLESAVHNGDILRGRKGLLSRYQNSP